MRTSDLHGSIAPGRGCLRCRRVEAVLGTPVSPSPPCDHHGAEFSVGLARAISRLEAVVTASPTDGKGEPRAA